MKPLGPVWDDEGEDEGLDGTAFGWWVWEGIAFWLVVGLAWAAVL